MLEEGSAAAPVVVLVLVLAVSLVVVVESSGGVLLLGLWARMQKSLLMRPVKPAAEGGAGSDR